MPFGLLNAPASFLNYINKILAKKLDILVIVYLDNILIYTKDTNQAHLDVVCWVLNKLSKQGLFADRKKGCFYKDEFRFLSYIVLA